MGNIYFSVDVECTGLNPIIHDVTSISVVELHTKQHRSFRIAEPAMGFWNWDEDTKEWAEKNIPASVEDLPALTPYGAVIEIEKFIGAIVSDETETFRGSEEPKHNAIFVAWPASFDYPFCQRLWFRAGQLAMPFHYRTVDVKSYMAGLYNVPMEAKRTEINKLVGFELWTEPTEPHNPYNDAYEQALVFERLLKAGEV